MPTTLAIISSSSSLTSTAQGVVFNTVTAAPVVITVGSSTYTNIPLSSIFTPPTTYSVSNYTYFSAVSNTVTFRQDTAGYNDAVSSKCHPLLFGLQASAGGTVHYSPGVCPSGYFAASANAKNETTTSVCCPSGATLYGVTDRTSSGAPYVYYSACYSTLSTSTTIATNGSSSVLDASAVFREPTILVVRAETDLDAFIPASAPLIDILSPTIRSNSSSATSSSASTDTTASTSSAVSGGAIAGIVIGALAAVVLLLVLVFYLLRMRRRSGRANASSNLPSMSTDPVRKVSKSTTELDSRAKHELAGATPELGGAYRNSMNAKFPRSPHERQELPGSV